MTTLLDTHVHVWGGSTIAYPWLAEVPDLGRVCAPHQIDRADALTTRMVAVEADAAPTDRLSEAQWIAGLQNEWPELAAIVAGVDLGGDVPRQLDALSQIDLVVGVRHQLQSEPAESWRVDAISAGLAELARRGWTFDACVRHRQLPAFLEIARSSPGSKIVIDHLGKPPVDAGIASAEGLAWKDSIQRLAELPNVTVKISGLAAESTDEASFDANADAFIAAAVEAFGVERSMIGSDWPVSAVLGGRSTTSGWVERVRRAVSPTPEEWDLLAGGVGERFYGLAPAR